jgi:DNA-binding XRE family transcriptional regulator
VDLRTPLTDRASTSDGEMAAAGVKTEGFTTSGKDKRSRQGQRERVAPTDELPPWIQQHRWDIGRRIRALRDEQGLTQIQLAERVGIDNKTVSRAENGRYPISVDLAARIARGLGVPSWRLFRD